MLTRKILIQAIALASLAASGGASHAAITVFTTPAAFTAAVSAMAVDAFSNITPGAPALGPLVRTAGSYGYTAQVFDPTSSSFSNTFYGAGLTADPSLSTLSAFDRITLGSFTGSVGAVGGNFFGTDVNGFFSPASVAVTATDSDGTISRTIVDATTSSFLGFVSSRGALTGATIEAIQNGTGVNFLWPTVDNLMLARPVPEPESLALLLAGLGVVSALARRRRA